ncbi:MAG: histidine kinase [Saprospiraceae bacterium]|nr:histidine kinase [Saprospiraceae bacterium]
MPVKYIYAILIGLGLGLILGAKTYLPYYFWEETHLYDWEKHFLPHFINNTLWGFLVPLVFLIFRLFPLGRNGNTGNRIKAGFASILVSGFHESFSWLIWIAFMMLMKIPIEENLLSYFIRAFPSALISRLVEFWIIYSLFAALAYARELRDKQVELARTEAQLYNARLTTLKRQMQPHFLFNTLNTISSLMEISIHDAQNMVYKLGTLLRRALTKNQKHWVPLREEVEFVQTYLDIEQTRFNDRLHIDYELDEAVLDTLVPALLLQPLVENAIKHGFSKSAEEGKISLKATHGPSGFIRIEVQDDGLGSPLPHEEILNKGIGLRNVRHRLELMYPNGYEMNLETSPGNGFKVLLVLPDRNDSVK